MIKRKTMKKSHRLITYLLERERERELIHCSTSFNFFFCSLLNRGQFVFYFSFHCGFVPSFSFVLNKPISVNIPTIIFCSGKESICRPKRKKKKKKRSNNNKEKKEISFVLSQIQFISFPLQLVSFLFLFFLTGVLSESINLCYSIV